MSELPVIRVRDLGKTYQLGQVGSGMFMNDLKRTWTQIRGLDDPLSKIGEGTNTSNVQALKSINFDIGKGEIVGLVGLNGAGKSTLLKLLTRITLPTEGRIQMKGKIASLLEVGIGFHPDLTGRENIFLNGAILGMRRHQIKESFEEIVGFSEIDQYIDTPVKRYSSGMYVRLAFAVAAFLDADIMFIDEVLAVGDAKFQQKAHERIKTLSEAHDRTIIYVSHNKKSMLDLCKRGLLLDRGRLELDADMKSVIRRYEATKSA